MSQARIKRRFIPMEVIDFSEDSWTDRGERVFKTLRVTCVMEVVNQSIDKVIACDNGLGMNETFIEDTIQGALAGLSIDFPHAEFAIERPLPNHIIFRWSGTRIQMVN